jgi:hypothetical protein
MVVVLRRGGLDKEEIFSLLKAITEYIYRPPGLRMI